MDRLFSFKPRKLSSLSVGVWGYDKLGHENRYGEDAWFVSSDSKAIGVADGVSEWARKGVNAAWFSNHLVSNLKLAYESCRIVNPQSLLDRAVSAMVRSIRGSCTSCTLIRDGENLRFANLGDSGFAVIRNGDFVFVSRPQQHFFNCPFQLSSDEERTDTAWHADCGNIRIHSGDLIVLATDGFWDNLGESEILKIVELERPKIATKQGTTFPGQRIKEQRLAATLAKFAFEVSQSETAISPFALQLKEQGEKVWWGGKPDDITVLVATVQ